jgi:glycosyltransferase involved in cell wall biosynthesis
MAEEYRDSEVVVVIPAFNEEPVIGETLKEVRQRFPRVIVVDDGSHDGTARAARAAGAEVVRHAVNLGQGSSLATGLAAALRLDGVRAVVTFDADGQHRVEDAQALVERLAVGDIDIALGTRFAGGSHEASLLRKAVLKIAVAHTRVETGLPLTDTHNGLRAMTLEFAAGLKITDCGMGHASDILSHIATSRARWTEVPVRIRYTEYSRSKGQPLINSVNIMFDRLMR